MIPELIVLEEMKELLEREVWKIMLCYVTVSSGCICLLWRPALLFILLQSRVVSLMRYPVLMLNCSIVQITYSMLFAFSLSASAATDTLVSLFVKVGSNNRPTMLVFDPP